MPQENQVLRCFSCETFQVHIVKKANKWECKICGAKQSFRRHYGKGTGKDCRNHVMKLNELRVTNSYSKNLIKDEIPEDIPPKSEPVPVQKKSIGKWAQYLEEETSSENQSEDFKPQKKRKKCEDYDDELKRMHEESDIKADKFSNYKSNTTGNSKIINCLQVEEGTTEGKKSKNIFDSGLDNAEDFLNFI